MALLSAKAFAQGQVNFSNYVPAAGVIAPFTHNPQQPNTASSGLGALPGWKAQLFVVDGSLRLPVGDVTTFRSSPPAAQAYLNAITVVVPEIAAGGIVTFVIRMWDGPSYGSFHYGESEPVTIVLGGGTSVPADLIGLQPIVVGTFLPEPSTIVLAALGTTVLLFRRRRSYSG